MPSQARNTWNRFMILEYTFVMMMIMMVMMILKYTFVMMMILSAASVRNSVVLFLIVVSGLSPGLLSYLAMILR